MTIQYYKANWNSVRTHRMQVFIVTMLWVTKLIYTVWSRFGWEQKDMRNDSQALLLAAYNGW